jgi:signal transduction histidine kinase
MSESKAYPNNIYREKKKGILRLSKKKYAIAILLLFLSSSLVYFIHYISSYKRDNDYKIINISGRQRMLSQKIALYTGIADASSQKERSKAISEFKHGMEQIEASRFMEEGFNSKKVFHEAHGVKELSVAYLGLTSQGSIEEVRNFSLKVLNSYDFLTHEIQHEAEMGFNFSKKLELFFYLLTLVILICEIVYIFVPLLRNVEKSFDELENSNDAVIHLSNLSLLGESISTLGHEIVNPLTVIKMTTQALEKDLDQGESDVAGSHKKINTVISQVDRIEKTIRSIKGLARKSGRDPFVMTRLDSIIDDALLLHNNKLKMKNVKVKINIDKTAEQVECHPGEIVQVISNLVGNSIDAMAEIEVPEIEILAREVDGMIVISILDNGPGIAVEVSDKVFESFFTTKSVDKGTGLGLSVARKIIENHGGEISLNQKSARTCFEIKLPPNRESFDSRKII